MLVAAAIALCGSSTAFAGGNDIPCVDSGKASGPCGTPQTASKKNSCVEIDCTDQTHTCSGPQSDYACSTTPYSSTCTQIRYFYDGNLGCTSTVVESTNIPVTCKAIDVEVGGCSN